ncbi:hypothetical protein [Methanoculleus frigidifontis]|nr:hypothetical protein [Methanoculleus sp. FWC-SCC1]
MQFPGGTMTLVPCPDGTPDAVEDVHPPSLMEFFVPEPLCTT